MNQIKIFNSISELFDFSVADFYNRAILAIDEKDIFTVVLSGGNTSKLFFNGLAISPYKIPWEKIHFFFGDERYVPLDDPQSNYLNADVHLFSKLPIPGENIHPMPTQDNDPVLSALHYEKHLRTFFKIDADQFPLFDLVYLGLG